MIPRKGRKEITVDGVLYHYKVSEGTHIVIQNSETNKLVTWYEETKPKWKIQIKPAFIRQLIIEKGV